MNVQNDTSNDIAVAKECLQAIAALERALHASPIEADVAERAVVRARDDLIMRLRAGDSPGEMGRQRALLDRFNTALSLIVAIEYPVSGIHHEMIQDALNALKPCEVENSTEGTG